MPVLMPTYIDIHTHNHDLTGCLSVINCFPDEKCEELPDKQFYSIGWHPWNIRLSDYKKSMQHMKNCLQKPNFIAVGETGLDKAINTPFHIQEQIFIEQIKIAEEFDKPVIIHCVRAFSEILASRKHLKPKQTWIIHGFNGNIQLARQLIEKNILLSFGHRLLTSNSKASLSLPEIPAEKFFLETDESNHSIETIYEKAAQLKNISVASLQKIIYQNVKQIFLKKL